ncbi:hypothetical protein N1851_022496 [Merluccius polli]|uniref:Uncharacterized protein n=1 Tax=Merluccius polli TaxID=89951 RepID=A0AA47NYF5_MERPO|nr:hypothetical protein N1851_022496 [Merluccius polli]
MVKDARASYFAHLIPSSKHNPKVLFDTINNIVAPVPPYVPVSSNKDCNNFLFFLWIRLEISGLASLPLLLPFLLIKLGPQFWNASLLFACKTSFIWSIPLKQLGGGGGALLKVSNDIMISSDVVQPLKGRRRSSVRFVHGHLQRPVAQVTEQQQSVGVPRAELEAHRRCVVIGPPRQLQEAGGVEEDGEGVRLHAGEGQVALSQRGGEQEWVEHIENKNLFCKGPGQEGMRVFFTEVLMCGFPFSEYIWEDVEEVQVEVVELSVGAEVLSVRVQGEVDIAAEAFDDHRVPVVVVQQAAAGHGGVAQDGAILVTACQGERATRTYTQVDLQQQLGLVELQGDVIPLLALAVQDHPLALRRLELQLGAAVDLDAQADAALLAPVQRDQPQVARHDALLKLVAHRALRIGVPREGLGERGCTHAHACTHTHTRAHTHTHTHKLNTAKPTSLQ